MNVHLSIMLCAFSGIHRVAALGLNERLHELPLAEKYASTGANISNINDVFGYLNIEHDNRLHQMAKGKFARDVDREYGQILMVPETFIHEHLSDFQARSLNAQDFPELQIIGAGLLVGQVLEIMTYDRANGTILSPTVVEGERNAMEQMGSRSDSMERLAAILNNRGSDKVHHGYHAFYTGMLDTLVATEAPIATLEVGLGTNNSTAVSTMGSNGQPGASNRAFRDYLPSGAEIYGADIDRDILYQEDRIKTAYVDQLDRSSFDSMAKDLGKDTFNLIIDDGLHSLPANLNVLLFGLQHVRKGGWVVIEDISRGHFSFWTSFVDSILRKNRAFRTMYVKLHAGDAYLVQRLE